MQVIRAKEYLRPRRGEDCLFFSRENIISFVPGLNSQDLLSLIGIKVTSTELYGVSGLPHTRGKSSILDAGEEWIVILSLRILRAIKRT